MKQTAITTVLCLGLGAIAVLALLWLLGNGSTVAQAQGSDSIDTYYVAPGGSCGAGISPCYASVQAAVDAADDPGDVIKVAAGTYTDVHGYPAPPGYSGSSVITQVVHISKTVTVRGGYTTTDWAVSDDKANLTTLDAQRQGRVLFIAGDISPTVEGLRMSGGDAIGLGGGPGAQDSGGGVYVTDAAGTIKSSQVFSNTATVGGGLGLESSSTTIADNTVFFNTADDGGGLFLNFSQATLRENTITSNTVIHAGGGVYLRHTDASVSRNTVSGNIASYGGGLCLGEGTTTFSDNTISYNAANGGSGGGLSSYNANPTITGNTILSNIASDGGGLYVWNSDATMVNNLVADNEASSLGGGLYIDTSLAYLLHTTVARNTGDNGVYVTGDDLFGYSSVFMTNTVLVSHTVGIVVMMTNTATLEATLWGSGPWANGLDWDGAGTIITGTPALNYWDDPAFVAPDDGDYHIGGTSAARDTGVDAGTGSDIDGDPRPMGHGHDLGADEFRISLSVVKQVDPSRVHPGEQMTYTLCVTNTGDADLHALITDALPSHVTPAGILSWTLVISTPNGVWTQTVVVTAEMGYVGPLTNVVQVASEEGATGAYTETAIVDKWYTYLPLVLRQYP